MENIKKKPTNNDKKPIKKEGAGSRDPVMKTAFICVIKDNMTGDNKDVLVTITAEQIKDILDEWAWSAGIEYWFIEHVSDDEEIRPHYHIVIKFRTNMHFSTIKNKFPFGRIEKARSIKLTVQYLVHLNNPEKIQYSWDQVITNCKDISIYKSLSRTQQELCLDKIIEKIKSGEITQVNYTKTIPIEIFSRYKTAITNAFQHKMDEIVLSNVSRPIKVIYMYGSSGVGKSEYAKHYCKALYPNEEPCESSSGNDPLQDYKGQQALILDDFRDSNFKYSDLLKLLDPHTRSSSKSRYINKHFLGFLIIITTTQRLDFLYKGCDIPDNMYELRRRITEYHEFVGDKIRVYLYIGNNRFKFFREHINPFYGWDSSPTSEAQFDYEVYHKMGIELNNPTKSESISNPALDLPNNSKVPPLQAAVKTPIANCEIIQYSGKHRTATKSITQTRIEETQPYA